LNLICCSFHLPACQQAPPLSLFRFLSLTLTVTLRVDRIVDPVSFRFASRLCLLQLLMPSPLHLWSTQCRELSQQHSVSPLSCLCSPLSSGLISSHRTYLLLLCFDVPPVAILFRARAFCLPRSIHFNFITFHFHSVAWCFVLGACACAWGAVSLAMPLPCCFSWTVGSTYRTRLLSAQLRPRVARNNKNNNTQQQ